MLVPAWDFAYLDGWLEARTTVFRGVENGYTVVRASREGLLTVSDPYGRILTETPSSELPGRSLLATVTVPGPLPTLYTRIGNLIRLDFCRRRCLVSWARTRTTTLVAPRLESVLKTAD